MPANQFLSFLISPTSFFFSLSLSLFSLYLAAVDIEEEDGCAVRGYYLDDRVPFLQQPEKLLLESGFFFSFLFFFFYYDEYRKGNKEGRRGDSICRFLIGQVRVLLLRWREERNRKGICFFSLLLTEIIIIFDKE